MGANPVNFYYNLGDQLIKMNTANNDFHSGISQQGALNFDFVKIFDLFYESYPNKTNFLRWGPIQSTFKMIWVINLLK